MILNHSTMHDLFTAFHAAFNTSFEATTRHHQRLALTVNSSTTEMQYGWLGSFPGINAWMGDRIIRNLSAHTYTITNKDFESTISVPRNSIADDQCGIYAPMFRALGEEAACHPDKLIFELLNTGHTQPCYDGKCFFDEKHPVGSGKPNSVSNNLTVSDENGPAWFLLCTNKGIRPFIFQVRQDYKLERMDRETDENVFMRREYLYGVDARVNVGFGLWQLAVRSTCPLTPSSFATARATMASFKNDEGRPLGLVPDLLVAPMQLEEQARILINCDLVNGNSNPWKGAADLLVTPWL